MFEFKPRKDDSKNIKICPLCKKPTLSKVFNGFAGERQECSNCDYEGVFFLEVNPEEAGDNFVDMEKLKKIFPEDVDPETEIDLSDPKNIQGKKNL